MIKPPLFHTVFFLTIHSFHHSSIYVSNRTTAKKASTDKEPRQQRRDEIHPIPPSASTCSQQQRVDDVRQVPPFASTSPPQYASVPFSSTVPSFIVNSLKYETLAKLSSPITRSGFVNSGLEGFETSELLVKTKCDLGSFISIVDFFRRRPASLVPHAFRLNPSSNSFQHPSRATQLLSIDFESLKQLLLALDIRDPSDHVKAGRRATRKRGARCFGSLAQPVL